MNCRLRGFAACLMLMGMWGWVAGAQPAAASAAGKVGAMPPGAFATPDAAKADIDAVVKKNVAALLDDTDPASQTKARTQLINDAYEKGQPANAGYLLVYSGALANEFTAALAPAKKPSLRQRLNVGIVTARVAALAQGAGSSLAPVAERLIRDPAEPVVLWGLKSAQPLLPEVIKLRLVGNQQMHPMIAAISPAVLGHPSGPVFEEAYTALGSVASATPAAGADAPYRAVMGELIKLWENRLEQYKRDIPEDPAVDAKPVFFLTTATMWKTLVVNAQTRTQVMQMVSDQMSMAAQYADGIQNRSDQDKRDQLIKLASQCAGGCFVVGGHQNIPSLQAVAQRPATQLNPIQLPWGMKIRPDIDPIVAEVAKVFVGIKPPPSVGAGAAGAGVARP